MPSLPPRDLHVKWYRMPLLILLSPHKECRMSLPSVLTEKLRLPVVGAPLPLISYGGTSLLTVLIGLGIVSSINIHDKEVL